MADETARIQWIQYSELVLGENHPDGLPDNDNRPLKQICLYSNLNPQAEDFPGFIGCYQVVANPNGLQVGNIRNGAWDVVNGGLWMKQEGDNTDTGWVPVGNYYGNGSPEGVVSALNGKFYEQRDGDREHPTWAKRTIPVVTWIANEWFNGINDTDIDGRNLDGGGNSPAMAHGTWKKHPGNTGRLDIVSSVAFSGVAFPLLAYYYVNGLTLPNADYCMTACVSSRGGYADFFFGVGIRFDTLLLNGYLAKISGDSTVELYKVVLGVQTVLDSTTVPEINALKESDIDLQIYGIGSKIVVNVNGREYIAVTDTTYAATGVPVLYAEDLSNSTHNTGSFISEAVYIGSIVASVANIGWYGNGGITYKNNYVLGDGAFAGNVDYNSLDAASAMAVGDRALAFISGRPARTFGPTAFGIDCLVSGDGCSAFGFGAEAIEQIGCSAFGCVATAYGDSATAIGFGAEAWGDDSLAVGLSASAQGLSSIAIGDSCTAFSAYSVYVGPGGYCDAPYGLALGAYNSINVAHKASIAMGGATTLSANQLMIGSGPTQQFSEAGREGINAVLIGWGDLEVTSKPITYRKTNAQGANLNAGDWTFEAGRSTGSAAPGIFDFKVGTILGAGSTLQTLSSRLKVDNLGIIVTGRISHVGSVDATIVTVTYSASMTIDSALGEIQVITATNGTAFTINAPTNPVTGRKMTITLRNTSGGALGAATWNAAFKMVAWVNPANTFSRSIEFYYNGSNWIETFRSAADITN